MAADPLDEFATKLAWEEYKLLQDKLDKLGDFRFRVKGWAVTVSSGLVAGGAVGKVTGLACLLASIVLVMFWFIELYYNRVHHAVVRRLRIVEHHLVRIQRQYKRRFRFASPGLVGQIELSFRGHGMMRRYTHSAFYLILGGLLMVSQMLLPGPTSGSSTPSLAQAAGITPEPRLETASPKGDAPAAPPPVPFAEPRRTDAAP